MNSTINTNVAQPTLSQTIGAILVAAFMWGSGNVLSRSLLIEGVNEIFLVTLRVTLIGSVLFLNYDYTGSGGGLLFINVKGSEGSDEM